MIGHFEKVPKTAFYEKTTLVSLIIWLIAVLTFFSPAIFSNKVIAPIDCLENVFCPCADQPIEEVHNHFVVDAVSQYLPYKWSIKKSFQEDGYVGWNPYTFNGNPIPDNTMVSPGDPFNLLYAVFPFWTAWNLGIILQFFIAGCGMILLLRHYRLPIWALLLGAISFAFYSQFILWMYHKWLGAMIWAPYLTWAMIKYRQHIVNVPAVVFLALLWRTGHLQACVFGFMIVACMWLSHLCRHGEHKPSLREIGRTTFSCLLIGILAALLSADVFVDTLQRMNGCKEMHFRWGFNNFLTLGTLLFPTTLGIPETLDVAKNFKLDLFDIKFGGSVVFILAFVACFNKRAPREAKLLFIVSLIAACTPLIAWLYSRSTLVMAMGMSWLAAWQLYDLTQVQQKNRFLKHIFTLLIILLFLWLAASLAIYTFQEQISEFINNFIRNRYSNLYTIREKWIQIRIARFVNQILIWDWRNLILCSGCLLGTYCCCKIRPERNNSLRMAVIVLLTFVELLTFSGTWITYSSRPESAYLYNEPEWIPEFRNHAKDGSVIAVNPIGDKDFWINNQLSAFNIRLADGYETVRPIYLQPLSHDFDTKEYARAGISHIISNTKWIDYPVPGWSVVMTRDNFKIWANPDYRGRYFTDENTPINPNWRTYNRINLTIPPHTKGIVVLESYHKGWQAAIDGHPCTITPTERGGMHVEFPASDSPRELQLLFLMPYRYLNYTIMLLTAIGLLVVVLRRKKTTNTTIG